MHLLSRFSLPRHSGPGCPVSRKERISIPLARGKPEAEHIAEGQVRPMMCGQFVPSYIEERRAGQRVHQGHSEYVLPEIVYCLKNHN